MDREKEIQILAKIIWDERCPGMNPSDSDWEVYLAAARAAMDVLIPVSRAP